MSFGAICDCSQPCRRYAADQELGGLCSSCSAGWHEPCDRPWAVSGVCDRCGWHATEHRKPCPVNSSITGQPCLLPAGHPADSAVRFHRYAAAEASA